MTRYASAVTDEDAFVAEVLRLHQRYAEEVVEAFNICPWARRAREEGEWERPVLLQRDLAIEPSLEVIRGLEADPRATVVAIVIYPRLAVGPRAFDEFAARVRAADQARHGGRPVYVAATFHPDYVLSDRSPAAAVPWFRRSPDPSIQLIRHAVIEEARGGGHGKFFFDLSSHSMDELRERLEKRSVTDTITADNHALLDGGRDRIAAIYRDILADRDRSYARFGG